MYLGDMSLGAVWATTPILQHLQLTKDRPLKHANIIINTNVSREQSSVITMFLSPLIMIYQMFTDGATLLPLLLCSGRSKVTRDENCRHQFMLTPSRAMRFRNCSFLINYINLDSLRNFRDDFDERKPTNPVKCMTLTHFCLNQMSGIAWWMSQKTILRL